MSSQVGMMPVGFGISIRNQWRLGTSVNHPLGLFRGGEVSLCHSITPPFHHYGIICGMNETVEMVLRLVLAGVLGGLIGAEREYRAKVAGTRTHLLVALGAALIMLVSKYGFDGVGDPGRVAAQIVSGIGFIGAGAIMVDKHAVHGLTTAAGIWVAAGIGMASAAGLYILAVAATVLSLVGLEVFGFFLFNDRRGRRCRRNAEDGREN